MKGKIIMKKWTKLGGGDISLEYNEGVVKILVTKNKIKLTKPSGRYHVYDIYVFGRSMGDGYATTLKRAQEKAIKAAGEALLTMADQIRETLNYFPHEASEYPFQLYCSKFCNRS
jgi:hypothetical protein